jgi:hypothetical protein
MHTTKPQTYKWAFVLEADDLHRLENLLEQSIASEESSTATYEVRLSDRSVINAGSADEVLELPNSKIRSITSIFVTTAYTNREIHARLSLENDRNRPVSYHLTGEDDKVLILADRLDEYLFGLRPWYSRLTRFSFVFFLSALYVVGYVLAALAAATDYFLLDILPGQPATSNSNSDPLAFGVLLVLFAAVFAICLALDWILKKIFPVGTFAVGQELKRHKTLGGVRAAVVGTILLSIPAGLFVNYIS